jgi:predicted nucleic acid-binding protein
VAIIALLDANAIWSAAVRDTLLLAAERDLFRPAWSRQILEEMSRALKARRPDLDPARIDRTVDRMLAHFPEALVEGYEDLIAAMRNHARDRHVLAAGVHAGAEVIVTWNTAHFPFEACGPYRIDIRTPDDFLADLWDLDPAEMVLVLREQAQHLVNPPKTPPEIAETLRRSVPRFADAVLRSGLL